MIQLKSAKLYHKQTKSNKQPIFTDQTKLTDTNLKTRTTCTTFYTKKKFKKSSTGRPTLGPQMHKFHNKHIITAIITLKTHFLSRKGKTFKLLYRKWGILCNNQETKMHAVISLTFLLSFIWIYQNPYHLKQPTSSFFFFYG